MKLILACSKVWNSSMKERLQKSLGAEVEVISHKADLTVEFLQHFKPDYVFFPHWSSMIPAEVYSNFVCIMFHMTDLPFGRGGSPLQNLIVRGFEETKMSAFVCEGDLDSGPVLLKKNFQLQGSAGEIYARATDLIEEMIIEIVTKKPTAVPQTGNPVIFQRRTPEESKIPEGRSEKELYDFIRMLDAEGYPAAFIEHGDLRIEFQNAELRDGALFATSLIKKKK